MLVAVYGGWPLPLIPTEELFFWCVETNQVEVKNDFIAN